MRIYKYNISKAHQLHLEYNGGTLIRMVLLYTLLLCIGIALILIGCIFEIIPLAFFGGALDVFFLIMLIVRASRRVKPAQTTFVYEDNVLYKMLFVGEPMVMVSTMGGRVASIAHNAANQFEMQVMAQDDKMIEELIGQHKKGIKTYSSFDGEGVKITEMRNIEVIRETKKSWIVKYEDGKGKKKEKEILKVFDIDFNNFKH